MLKLGPRNMNWKDDDAASINTNPNPKFSLSQNSVYFKNESNISSQYGQPYSMSIDKPDNDGERPLNPKGSPLNDSPTSHHDKFDEPSGQTAPNNSVVAPIMTAEEAILPNIMGVSSLSSFPPSGPVTNHRPSLPHYPSVPPLQQMPQFAVPAPGQIPAFHSYAPQPNYYPVPIPGFLYAPNIQAQNQLPHLPPLAQSNPYYPEFAGTDPEAPLAAALVGASPVKRSRKTSSASTSTSSGHTSPKKPTFGSSASKTPRGSIKRSRMGCITCRQRKKRCCETKPNCSECSRLRLSCVWPVPGTEHKNKSKELKEEENVIHHEIYGRIKVLRGIVEYKSDE